MNRLDGVAEAMAAALRGSGRNVRDFASDSATPDDCRAIVDDVVGVPCRLSS